MDLTAFSRAYDIAVFNFRLRDHRVILHNSAAFLLALWIRCERFRWVKAVLTVLVPIVLVLPWAEEVWIAWSFAKLCEGAGIQVKRQVEVPGFYNDTTTGYSKAGPVSNPQAIRSLESTGYRFIERRTQPLGKVSHVERNASGEWQVTIIDQPKSRYHFRRLVDFRDDEGIHHEERVAHRVEILGTMVVDSKINEIIGKDVQFTRRPNLIEWQWIRFFGQGLTFCYGPLDNSKNEKRIGGLPEYIFIPKT